LRCCTKIISKDCPHILQPQPLDFLMLYDDPSYVDESTNAPYMKNAERKQEIHRKRVERKFNGKEDPADKDGGGEDNGEKSETENMECADAAAAADNGDADDANKEGEEEGGDDDGGEAGVPTQTLTLGSCLASLAASDTAPPTKDDEVEKEKQNGKEEKVPWVWPQPFKPKPPTKRQRKQKKDTPQGLNCMFSVPDLKRRKYNHSWVQVHNQKPWIAIPCVKRLIQRRDEMKEEFEDLVKHLKWHPEDTETIKKKRDVEKVFKRLRNRVHSFLKRLELQYLTTGYEGVTDLIAQFLEERQDEDGLEVIFKKEHDDAAAERLAAEEEAKRLEESKRPREESVDEANGGVVEEEGSSKRTKTDDDQQSVEPASEAAVEAAEVAANGDDDVILED